MSEDIVRKYNPKTGRSIAATSLYSPLFTGRDIPKDAFHYAIPNEQT